MSRFRLTLWIAFADFFSALALLLFAQVVVASAKRPPPAEPRIQVEREVKDLAQAICDELKRRGVEVPALGDNVAIVLPELLLFASGDFDIRDPVKANHVAEALKAVRSRWRDSFVLVIQGHTDARPPRSTRRYADNLELSRLRARQVERFMTQAGVAPPAFQVVAQGVGPTQPVVPNCRSSQERIECDGPDDFRPSEELAANRRIELRFGVFSGNTR